MAETLLATVLFIVPGYIAASTRRYWSFMPPPAETAIGSVVWSLAIYLILGAVPSLHMEGFIEGVTSLTAFLSSPRLLFAYFGVIVFAVISGLAVYWFISRDEVVKVLGQSPYETVWDEFWRKNGQKNRWVVALTSRTTGWVGKVVSASGRRADRELWLCYPKWFEDGDFTNIQSDHVVVSCKDILAIMMLPEDLAN